MANVIRLQSSLLKRLIPAINRRLISTSKKNRDTVNVAQEAASASKAVVTKNWVSYGFETKSESADLNALHSIFFISISVCIVFGGFCLAYVPDYNLSDWSQREAFLELRRREAAGVPLLDCNLINPATIKLPSDEELGDTEIII